MIDALRGVLEADERVAYALVFGSRARGASRPGSDVDIALGLRPGVRLKALELGGLSARLESAAGHPIDLVILDEAPPPLAYRVFRDGRVVLVRDRPAFVARKAQAILEYLDFRPIEELCARGVLAAAARGR